jgi:hypothetical protein
MKIGKKQHIIPRFYLNQFIHPGWVYLRGSKQPKLFQSARSVSVKEWYYSKDTDGKDYPLDAANMATEGIAAPILRELLITKEGLPNAKKRLFSYFIANLALRVPATIEEMAETLLNAMEKMDDMFKKQLASMGKEAIEKEEVDVKADEAGPKYDSNTGSYSWTVDGWKRELESMRKAVREKRAMISEQVSLTARLAPIIAKMSWFLFDAPTGTFFITSDRPVYLTNIDGTRLGAGWGNMNVLGTLPLSPRRYLMLSYVHPSDTWGYKRLSPKEVESLNWRTIASAKYAVYSPENYPPAEKWLSKALQQGR